MRITGSLLAKIGCRDPPPTETAPPLDREPLAQRPFRQETLLDRNPGQRPPWTETLQTETPPGQTPSPGHRQMNRDQ